LCFPPQSKIPRSIPARLRPEFRLPSHCRSGLTTRTPTKGNCMAQAIMDPEKVRRFADELQRFNTDLENRLTLLHARFTALGDTWNDQEHEKFADEFKQTLKALKKFIELSREHTPYLIRKAQRIEEYLNQH